MVLDSLSVDKGEVCGYWRYILATLRAQVTMMIVSANLRRYSFDQIWRHVGISPALPLKAPIDWHVGFQCTTDEATPRE